MQAITRLSLDASGDQEPGAGLRSTRAAIAAEMMVTTTDSPQNPANGKIRIAPCPQPAAAQMPKNKNGIKNSARTTSPTLAHMFVIPHRLATSQGTTGKAKGTSNKR